MNTKPTDAAAISLLDTEVLRCPFAAYKSLRDQAPVAVDPMTGFYVVTRFEDIRRIAQQPEIFSNATQQYGDRKSPVRDTIRELMQERGWLHVDTLQTNDPPSHRGYRSLVDKAFRAQRLQEILPGIEDVIASLLDRMAQRHQSEFVTDFAVPLPMTVIGDQLGVPRERAADFKRWSDATLEGADPRTAPERLLELAHIQLEMQQFFAEQIAIARQAPRQDIVSDLVTSTIEDREPTMRELQSILMQLLVAGNETTTNALGSAMLTMIREGVEPRLREQPERIPAFVEEVLRLEAPLQNLFRRATQDTEIGGVPVPAGAILAMSWGAANRDERRFENPDELRLDRPGGAQHVTFGHGIHYCVGNLLARAELKSGLRMLLRRFRNFRLQDRDDAVVYLPHFVARGPRALHIAFDPA